MAEHLALYRKWRPLVFDDVFGQDHIVAALRNQVQNGRTSHAYLFTGTRGTGKTTCAKILARAVCCEHPVNGNPCNTCAACRSILEDAALDVSEIDAASNNGVDNIREIRDEAAFSPAALKKRVYIIDEVHMLSPGAFNALLKTLEEPPEHVLFILATTEIHKVPATVLSRCQRYDFRRIPPEILAARLFQIAREEGFELTNDAASLLARLGDGSMRDAISLLDRSASADGKIDLERVTAALGVPSAQTVLELYRAVYAGDSARALELFTGCYLEGRDIVSLFDQLLSLLRDLYLLKATGREEYLMSSSAANGPLLRQLAEEADAALLEYFTECVSDLLTRLTRVAIKRTDGEMCLLKMCLRHRSGQPLPAGTGTAAPVSAPQPVSKEEAPAAEQKAPAPAATPAAAPAEAKPRRTAAPVSGGDADLRSQVMAVVSPKVNSGVRTYLNMSEMRKDGDVLEIACQKISMVFMEKPAVVSVLLEAARQCGCGDIRLKALDDASAPPRTIPAEEPKNEPPRPADDPLQKILENARKLGVEVKE
ncbi:MAG: DNA polymerase III subunit gamma/tau [Clostridia bacterium]|nr:DNA polymerase III subunit gamma/tau [Clostridia bacterium]